jgi:hypothetical protein
MGKPAAGRRPEEAGGICEIKSMKSIIYLIPGAAGPPVSRNGKKSSTFGKNQPKN